MTFPVRETFKEIGVERIAAVSGIPMWTLYKWHAKDAVPGKGVAHEMRVERLTRAIAQIRAAKKPAAKRKGRA